MPSVTDSPISGMVICTVVPVAIGRPTCTSACSPSVDGKLRPAWLHAPDLARLKFWGWGYEDQQPSARARCARRRRASRAPRLRAARTPSGRSRLDDLELPAPRARPAGRARARSARTEPYERASHAYGKAYRDVVRAFRGRFDHPPDVVARAARRGRRRARARLVRASRRGGDPVRRRHERRRRRRAARRRRLRGRGLDRPARARPGARGRPRLARGADPGGRDRPARSRTQLREHGLHAAPLPAVVRVLDARRLDRHARGRPLRDAATRTSTTSSSRCARSRRAAVWESRRLPGSGAGPSPDRMLLGSEGTLGVITEAWVRVQDRPRFRGVGRRSRFARFEPARGRGARAVAQSGLYPANCRLLDAGEAALTGAAPDGGALLVLGLRVGRPPARRRGWTARSSCCRDHGGDAVDGEEPRAAGRRRRSGAWRGARSSRRRTCATRWSPAGVVADTFETAITWDRLRGVRRAACATRRARRCARCGGGHASPAGSPTSTPTARRRTSPCLAPARRGVRARAVGRGQGARRPRRSSPPAARSPTTTRSAATTGPGTTASARSRSPRRCARRSAAVDPAGMLNPGVLIDP